MTIRYSVRRADAQHFDLAVRIDVEHAGPGPLEIVLPSWVPGSYKIQDSASGVGDLVASAGSPAAPAPTERLTKDRWRIDAPPGPVEVRYRFYAHEMVTEAADVSDAHLFLNPIRCLPYVEGRRAEPHELALEVPGDWSIVTELPEAGGATRFRATDYDELVDSPLDAGTPRIFTFSPQGIRHRLSVCGSVGNLEPHRFVPDLERAVAGTIRYFGDSPLTSYTFFVHLHEVSDGGLEHATSNSCVVPRFAFRPNSTYRRWLYVAAHEYFHLYMVKRIRPAAFLPFDYTREVYTRLLWLMEGTTDYVSNLILRRSGLLTPTQYFENVAKAAGLVVTRPGRHHQSLEEASLLAWIDLYKPQENSWNRSITYYHQGHLASLMLDLELLDRSERRASLQDVLRHLWREYGRVGRGIPEGEFPAIVERATGIDVREFHRKYLAGTAEIDLDRYARLAGLSFGPVPKRSEPDDDGDPGYLGIDTRVVEGTLRIVTVRDGGAGQHAGLAPGDELVAIDGARIPAREFDEVRKSFPPGTAARLTVARRGVLTEVPVTFGSPPPEKYRFAPLPEATATQRAVYEAWLETPWAPPKPDAPAP